MDGHGLLGAVEDDIRARAAADALMIEVADLDELDGGQFGQVVCWKVGDGFVMRAVRKRSLPKALAPTFDDWARQRAYMLALTGNTEADGWFRRSDGGWQITARLHDLPTLD